MLHSFVQISSNLLGHSIASDADEEKKENEQTPTASAVPNQKDLLEEPTASEETNHYTFMEKTETSISDVVQ